jgi:glycosyltransferase involved in cell wall biosynthesis
VAMSKVGICIPARGQVEVGTAFDLAALVNYTNKNSRIEVHLYTSMGTLIFDQRNNMVQSAMDDGCSHVLFIDADMRFPKDTLIRLLNHNKGIVGVNATTRSEPVKPTAKKLEVKDDHVIWHPVWSKEATGIEVVDGIGCGVMLIDAEVIKGLEKPYFYFEQLPNHKILGEDIYFCIKASDAGFPTYVDHDLSKEIKHIGSYQYGWHNISME